MILFYDYLLTLGDEVRRDYLSSFLRFATDTTFRRSNIFGLGRGRGVRKPLEIDSAFS